MKIILKFWSTNIDSLNYFIDEVLKLIEQLGIEKSGPIPLKTKVLRVPSMRTLGKRGTKIWETYQMRVHRRIIEIKSLDERFFKSFLRLQIPPDVKVAMKIIKE